MGTITLSQAGANQRVEPIQLHRYVTEAPQKNFFNLKCKAITLKALEIICLVAFVSIMATVFSIYFSGTVLTGTPALFMAGLIIATPFLSMGALKFLVLSSQISNQAGEEGKVALYLKKLLDEGWDKDPKKIQQFFTDQNIDISQLPLEALKQVNAQNPLNALLPLIARFQFLRDLSDEAENSYKNEPIAIEEGFRKNETKNQRPIPPENKRDLRLKGRNLAYTTHEALAIPKALEAAVVLQILQRPTLAGLQLSQLGELRAKTFDERFFDRIYTPINDDYLVFHPKYNRAALTLSEIERDLSPNVLRQKLFPFPIRA